MECRAQPEAIDRATLTAPLWSALRSARAEVHDWRSTTLSGDEGNPISLGLYRFHGTGEAQAGPVR